MDAKTPEELEALLEDAHVVRDAGRVAGLYLDSAVLTCAGGHSAARGAAEIASFASWMWARDYTYLAEPAHVIETRDTALIIARDAVNVGRREPDGTWRYAISLLKFSSEERKDQR
jgi:ketosteroid isomerase-like protein